MLNLVVDKVTTGLSKVTVGFRKLEYGDTKPDVLTAVLLRITVFWDMMPYRLVCVI
jgi:hypothetical protein